MSSLCFTGLRGRKTQARATLTSTKSSNKAVKSPLSFIPYDMRHSSTQLCNQCNNVDFTFFTKNHQGRAPRTELDLNQNLSTTCNFCKLIRHCADKSKGHESAPQAGLRGVYDGREFQLYADSKRLDYSVQSCEYTPESNLQCSIHVSESYDSSELKKWLRECDAHRCLPDDQPKHGHQLPKDFRVIDIIDKRIVYPDILATYCALSYVWGSMSHSFLNTSTQRELESEGGINEVQGFPQTIVDAMDLCKDIGCRYLWVDSLCIIQDDEQDRHSQIRSMADIYSQSYVTIIAASGKDAHSGLPPYGKFGRRAPIQSLVVNINGLGSFVATMSPQIAAEDIINSTWASRGWTLQEQALSRRVLFFTGTYTFFRCEHSLWSEDFGLGFSKSFDKIEKWDLPLPSFYRRKQMNGHLYSTTYKKILGEYLRREKNLRHPEDILNAITGVLIRLRDDIGDHLYGLPSKRFSAALQWSTDEIFPGRPRRGFPSWSWAGWHHEIHYVRSSTITNYYDVYKDSDVEDTNQSLLSCWVANEDLALRKIEHSSIDFISQQMKEAISNARRSSMSIGNLERDIASLNLFRPPPDTVLDFYDNWQSPSPSPISQHVFIWGSCATLYVSESETEVGRFSLLEHLHGNIIGSIELRSSWRKTAPNNMEFLVTTAGLYSADAIGAMEVRVRIILLQLLHEGSHPNPPVYMRIPVPRASISLQNWASGFPKDRLIALV